MAGRLNKTGLDYFPLDCHMDEKVELIEAEYGLKGFAIIVKLYQSIYSGFGYYCEWSPEISVLWAYRLGCTQGVAIGNVGNSCDERVLSGFPKNLINEVVSAAIRRDIFSKDLFEKYGILTSSGIQKRYLSACYERKQIEMKKEYLLISIPKNQNNVAINSINRAINSINRTDNEQSKGKESKEKNNTCASELHDDEKSEQSVALSEEEQLQHDFDIIYALYPKKRGKTVAFENYKHWVSKQGKNIGGKRYRLTNRQIYLAVKKYIHQQEENGQDDLQYWKNFDTLMGRQLLDYVEWEDEK